jgi:hypothetical protein
MSRSSAALGRRSTGDGSAPPDHHSDRLAALEAAVAVIQKALDLQFARIAQMQAQIDLLLAKDRSNG